MKSPVAPILIVILLAWALIYAPLPARSQQSPLATPTALAPTSPLTPMGAGAAGEPAPGVPPLIWIVAGLILGGLLVLLVQRRPSDAS